MSPLSSLLSMQLTGTTVPYFTGKWRSVVRCVISVGKLLQNFEDLTMSYSLGGFLAGHEFQHISFNV